MKRQNVSYIYYGSYFFLSQRSWNLLNTRWLNGLWDFERVFLMRKLDPLNKFEEKPVKDSFISPRETKLILP